MTAAKKTIDLRSDTVTKPTDKMRNAMFEAEVGDDVYGEDPTVNRLEEIVADMLGKEKALFVASGTMANLVSVLTHCQRGDEVILGDQAHIFLAEQAGAAAVGGVQLRTVSNEADGTLDLEAVENAIRPDNEHYPITRLICLENTQNHCGGQALPVAYMDAAGELAHRHGLQLHVDGARLWNAAVALHVPLADLVRNVDSVSVCLSKGLGAPVGSLVVGTHEFIVRARRNRKVLGGGMRQAGILAAAGIVAVTEMIDRLAEDHANASRLAHGLEQIDGVQLWGEVESNLIFFDLVRADMTPQQFAAGLQEQGVLLSPAGGRSLRAVTNLHITEADVETALDAVATVLASNLSHVSTVNSAY